MKLWEMILAVLAGFIIGALWGNWLMPRPPTDVTTEAGKTDQIIRSLDEAGMQSDSRAVSIDRTVRRDVEVIRRETREKILALSDDDVADIFNDLLDRWRREQSLDHR